MEWVRINAQIHRLFLALVVILLLLFLSMYRTHVDQLNVSVKSYYDGVTTLQCDGALSL